MSLRTVPMIAAELAMHERKKLTMRATTFLFPQYSAQIRTCKIAEMEIERLSKDLFFSYLLSAIAQAINPVHPCHRNQFKPEGSKLYEHLDKSEQSSLSLTATWP